MPRLRYLHPDAGNCAQPAVRHQVEGQLLQQSPGSRASGVRGTIDRRLEYAVSDLRGDRRQRVDGSQRDPERSECVHVVLLQCSGADTGPACELHTLNLWESHADPDSDSNSYAYADTNTNGYSNSYAHTDSYAYVDAYGPAETKPDAEATSDTAASPVSGSGKLIVHSAAGVARPRLRAFVPQASSLLDQPTSPLRGWGQLGALVKGGSSSPWRAVAFGGGGRTHDGNNRRRRKMMAPARRAPKPGQ